MKVHRAVSPRERILGAADRLFYEHGIRAVGVDAVAAEADVSKRTLYKHYPSKDALVSAYLTGRLA
ncbi:MAG: helix-turn-helix transcriptional regulator, partial [Betaproteobacteria bacterium]|nr:helix-turn-helix transcriptional regulator [Betaproteobacteria bacterium]